MIFRRADERDVKRIMEMIHQAQEDLKSQGVDQAGRISKRGDCAGGYQAERKFCDGTRRRDCCNGCLFV